MQPNPAYGFGNLDPDVQLDQCAQCGCWAPRDEMKVIPGDVICIECDIDRDPGDETWASR